MKRLTEHRWPGNIRELRSVVERAVVVYARGKTLTESDVSKALGASRLEIEVERAAPPPLNLRQRQFLTLIGRRRAGTDIAELMASAEWGRDHAGHSRRTLQNDLRKLTDLGYLSWYKSGSARVYAITPQGDALRTQLESAGTDIDTGEAVNAEEKD
jgi:DNA-binding NtrC family response regulator